MSIPGKNKRPRYNMVHGVSDRDGMPRIGKLRLGEKKTTTDGREYPSEIDYFRIDPANDLLPDQKAKIVEKFHELYGERPATLTEVFFPSDDIEFVFPNGLESWKRTQNGPKLWCTGNGVQASRLNFETGAWEDLACCHSEHCPIIEKGDCKLMSRLRIFLPRVSMSGYFQIDTSSQASTGNILDLINQLDRMFGRLTSIPLVLSRVPTPMVHEGKTQTHYIMQMRAPNVDLDEMKRIVSRNSFALPAAPAEVEDDDVPEELVPATLQEPEADAELLNRIERGFDILGKKEADRLVALNKYRGREEDLLLKINEKIDQREAP